MAPPVMSIAEVAERTGLTLDSYGVQDCLDAVDAKIKHYRR